jgi:hypothetical protein
MTRWLMFLASPRARWVAALAWLLIAAAAGSVAAGFPNAEKNGVLLAVFCLGLLGYEPGMTRKGSEGRK